MITILKNVEKINLIFNGIIFYQLTKTLVLQTQEDVSIEQIMKFADWKPFFDLGTSWKFS